MEPLGKHIGKVLYATASLSGMILLDIYLLLRYLFFTAPEVHCDSQRIRIVLEATFETPGQI